VFDCRVVHDVCGPLCCVYCGLCAV
jgi:hypothetical protein